ncbi:hypothetical protein GCM10009677_28100 [Sphaerisporangium rubeum]
MAEHESGGVGRGHGGFLFAGGGVFGEVEEAADAFHDLVQVRLAGAGQRTGLLVSWVRTVGDHQLSRCADAAEVRVRVRFGGWVREWGGDRLG